MLEELIQSHPEWQLAIQNLTDLWQHRVEEDPATSEDAYLLHLQRMNDLNISLDDTHSEPLREKTRSHKPWYWAAAAIILLIASYFGYQQFSGNQEREQLAGQLNEISTRPGSKSKVQLPDGSVVWLNAGSKLTYDKDFGQEIREVNLTGEGFFDVAKNKEKPFIINTNSIRIKVLGTAFNVKAYPEDKHTETSLIRGSIEVTIRSRPNDKIILSPSEKLVVENDIATVESMEKNQHRKTGNIARTEVPGINTLMAINKLKYNPKDSSVAEIQWVNNKLVFRDESFSELAVQMERWYDVQIDITDPAIADERLNGIFESETIVQALEALKEFIPFQYEKTGSKIIIHR